ncbi:NAD-dependent deacetylase sirtuin-2, putative [Pediculus humanus corporis]|uniref:NAD-dependent protein deacetylase n=1 Tax=Pediculus humanus subsp. corporis TaxID=121224 RepID=E0VSM4_PEDHC|nr:NAD-dependent deacetylase sirtuin-2, putative [Pediculus humanus corporis]EEB16380.1 NAD-dependent deacetylase sirtuin-2, putative [Pediculus humanus corporis]
MGANCSLLPVACSFCGQSKKEKAVQVLDEVSITGIVNYIKSDKCQKIVVMAGAGISTSAGIPDFRSPGSGLYDNLGKYKLPHPQAIFAIDYFKENPEPFFHLAKELFPGSYKPTVAHYFVRLLHEKGLLLRHYTQNIDGLEKLAGIPSEKVVEAHGTFYTSHCLSCKKKYSLEWMKNKIFTEKVPLCEDCKGVVKPDIVFFGENLPNRFFSLSEEDFPKADLLIIMGSSLAVQPFASLVDRVNSNCPRLLLNREKAGQKDKFMSIFGLGGGLDLDSDKNYRDVAFLGDCDELCEQLVDLLGWKQEFDEIIKKSDEQENYMKSKGELFKFDMSNMRNIV